MLIDLYKKDSALEPATGPEATAYLAAAAGEPLPQEIIHAGWSPEEPGVEVGAAEALELFDISEDTLMEQIEDRGYALSAKEGQVRAASSLASH